MTRKKICLISFPGEPYLIFLPWLADPDEGAFCQFKNRLNLQCLKILLKIFQLLVVANLEEDSVEDRDPGETFAFVGLKIKLNYF